MDTNSLGTDQLQVSAIGLGCNNFGRSGSATETLAGTRAVIDVALAEGITFFDTAAAYGGPESMSERLIGKVLQGRRDEVLIATKWGMPTGPEPREWGARGSRGFIPKACEASLRRLQTDRIDLFQMHRPDPDTPIAETVAALDELVTEGKIRFFGSSGFDAALLREADKASADAGSQRFVSAQNEYSLLSRGLETEVIPALEQLSIGLLPYFPLASGLLTGKYAKDSAAPEGSRLALAAERFDAVTDAQWAAVERFRALCAELGLPMVHVAFAWLLGRPVVSSVIAGATTVDQVRQNAAAAGVRLDAETMSRLDAIFPVDLSAS